MKNFYLLWLGQLISSIGSGLSAFALGIVVYQHTGSASNYSWVILAAFLPALLLRPIGGALADRFDRRHMMMLGDIGSAFGNMLIIVAWSCGSSFLWPIYLGNVISSLFLALQNPAYKASITDLVEEQHYAKASGFTQLAESSKYLISPLIAAFLMKLISIEHILLLDTLSFILAALAVFVVKRKVKAIPEQTVQQKFREDLWKGFAYLHKRKGILCLISVISMITFFIGLLQALLGPMILAFADSHALGLVQGLATSGMLIGGLFMGLFGKTNKKLPMVSLGLVICGLFLSLIGVSTNLRFITFFGFLFFVCLPVVNANLDVLIRSHVENEMQSRVWSLVSLISQLGMAIAFGIAGFLADKLFNPLMMENGSLANLLGHFLGVGEGRGIGLMFVISGFLISLIALLLKRLKVLRELES